MTSRAMMTCPSRVERARPAFATAPRADAHSPPSPVLAVLEVPASSTAPRAAAAARRARRPRFRPGSAVAWLSAPEVPACVRSLGSSLSRETVSPAPSRPALVVVDSVMSHHRGQAADEPALGALLHRELDAV